MGDAVLSDYNVIIRMVTEYNSPKENQELS
nr:MAG TPA: hypothetical protein [Caudoviricetes sp.]